MHLLRMTASMVARRSTGSLGITKAAENYVGVVFGSAIQG
jgi:hypothetical protein